MSVNKAILLGNVGADPVVRNPVKGQTITTFPLATNEQQPNGMQLTEWHRIVCNGPAAEYAERYIRKGTKLYIEGRLRTRSYTDRLNIERKITEIYVDNIEILGRENA